METSNSNDKAITGKTGLPGKDTKNKIVGASAVEERIVEKLPNLSMGDFRPSTSDCKIQNGPTTSVTVSLQDWESFLEWHQQQSTFSGENNALARDEIDRSAACSSIDFRRFGNSEESNDLSHGDRPCSSVVVSLGTAGTMKTLTMVLEQALQENDTLKRRLKKYQDAELLCLDITSNIQDIVTARLKGNHEKRDTQDDFENRESFKFLGGGNNGEVFKVTNSMGKDAVVLKAIPFASMSKDRVEQEIMKAMKEVRMQKMAERVCPEGVVLCHVAFTCSEPSNGAASAFASEIDLNVTMEHQPKSGSNFSSGMTPFSKRKSKEDLPLENQFGLTPDAKNMVDAEKNPDTPSSLMSYSDENASFRSMVIVSMEMCTCNFSEYVVACGEKFESGGMTIAAYFVEILTRFVLTCQYAKVLHDNDLEHKDLHGGNIFLCQDATMDNAPRIGDFGLARTLAEAGEISNSEFGVQDVKYLGEFLHEIFNEVLSTDDEEFNEWNKALADTKHVSPFLLYRLESQDISAEAFRALKAVAEISATMKGASDRDVIQDCIETVELALVRLKTP